MTSRKSQFRIHLCCAVLIFFLTIAPNIGWGQANSSASAPFPPASQDALNKGIIAAKVPDYLLAIRFFEEARKIAPQAPVIYLNLGLAESRIPGRELRAIAWFGAYLAAYPSAPNAAAVKEQIAVLDVRNQSNVSRLVKSVQDAASQLSGSYKSNGMEDVAKLWAKAGDIKAALKTADLLESEEVYKGYALRWIASSQAEAGDSAGALKTADLIQSASRKSEAQEAIAIAQAMSGDIAGAQNTADLIRDANHIGGAQLAIAKAQAEAGDIAGAQKTATRIQNAHWKNATQRAVAEVQAKSGDIAGAQKTADFIQDAFEKTYAQRAIAIAQAMSGDIAGAQKTLVEAQNNVKHIQDRTKRIGAQREIVDAKTKAVITNAPNSIRQSASDNTELPVRPVIAVSDWLKKLDDDKQSNDCPLNTEPFLDLAGHLKSLPPSDNPYSVFQSLGEAAGKIVTAQNVISKMLKQQAGQRSPP